MTGLGWTLGWTLRLVLDRAQRPFISMNDVGGGARPESHVTLVTTKEKYSIGVAERLQLVSECCCCHCFTGYKRMIGVSL